MNDTVTSKAEIERLFHEGRRSSSSLMTLIALPSQEGNARGKCMFVAGKKLGSAPLRNRCKRVLRATASELGAPWSGYDVVFMAKANVAHAPHARVVSCMRDVLAKASVR